MKVFVVSLGCPKNRTDTEEVLAGLRSSFQNFTVTNDLDEAGLILVNTCAFIEEAVEESIETILELAHHKKPHQLLMVMGCLYRRYEDALQRELPEVDIFFGHRLTSSIVERLTSHPVAPIATHGERVLTTPPWRAYLKIIEGCSRRCTYCLIPGIRGERKPRPPDVIMHELEILEKKGVKEVTLVGQDLTSWSWNDQGIKDLLEAMDQRSRIPWIRPLYFHPAGVNTDLLKTVYEAHRICNYLDIPIQHASSRILKRMGRPYDTDYLKRLFSIIREDFPEISLRTTVMVGFPGEKERDFQELMDLIEEIQFDHLGCFIYSDEEEALSHKLGEKVPKKIAEERRHQLLAFQRTISRKRLARWKGKCIPVLVEGLSRETELLLEGRSEFQAPEVDGVVYINQGNANEGEFYLVEITEIHDYDLVGGITTPLVGQAVYNHER